MRSADRPVYRRITVGAQLLLAGGVVAFLLLGEWSNAAYAATVIVLSVAPLLLRRHLQVDVPAEFQLVALGFVFAAVMLGTVFGFYDRFWWWDTLLHTVSGFLLGIVGFIAVFVLNGTDRMPSGMRPSFVSIFGFTFAVTLGVVWEIWEFVGDLLVPSLDMQIAASGVQDTMIDLLVNTVGAAIVALVGYAYLRKGRRSLVVDGVVKFLRRNPALFGRSDRDG
ncbi:MAG TPA: hypothetical protein VFN19_10385 [Candidatus Nanopelagicales bacterium]|nr:hypothetical protein [Candidatus Nanopelagicales bacterium]